MKRDETFEVTKTDAEWQETLSPKQYQVLREHGTEMRGSSALNQEKRPGTFVCAGCGQPLFASEGQASTSPCPTPSARPKTEATS